MFPIKAPPSEVCHSHKNYPGVTHTKYELGSFYFPFSNSELYRIILYIKVNILD